MDLKMKALAVPMISAVLIRWSYILVCWAKPVLDFEKSSQLRQWHIIRSFLILWNIMDRH
jgi:hypothetical protein